MHSLDCFGGVTRESLQLMALYFYTNIDIMSQYPIFDHLTKMNMTKRVSKICRSIVC